MSEKNENKKYESYKIPERQQVQGSGVFQTSPKANTEPISSLSDGMFYEIEYDTVPVQGVGKFVLSPQKIKEPKKDEIRELFYRMRDISRMHRSTYDSARFFDRRVQYDNAKLFYHQGVFMKDFADDYPENMQFSQYFPSYHMMGYEQLRTYFTWRTQVRKGNVADTSLSYAFLYIYELLGNIGVDNPKDGLDKLLFFWRSFSAYNKSINRYVLRWLKDYHIYYELPHTWAWFVGKNDLTHHYPDITGTDDDFDLFCSISKYDIRKSTFFSDETSKMIADCFSFVITRVRQDFEIAGIHFDDVLFRPTKKIAVWKPFKDALFFNHLKQSDRRIVFSKNEIYMCIKNNWTFSGNLTTDKGKQFIGYVMKKMESVLRTITKYRYKLNANANMIHEDTIRILTKAELYIEKIVPAAVMEFHREATKTVITVDHDSLAKIRQEALATQESLIVEEQAKQRDIVPALILFTAQNQNVFSDPSEAEAVAVAVTKSEPASPMSVWDNLKNALNEEEIRALAVVLQGGDIKIFSDECGIMLEVLVDGINEKAMDYIGDNLMDDEFFLHDDYKEQVKELIK